MVENRTIVRPVLMVISGLPGTGKSTVAEAVSRRTGAVHLSVDELEDALLGSGLAHDWRTGVAAYEAVRAAAEQNLTLGHRVVVDAVNDSEPARETWRRAARSTGASLGFVLLAPPAATEHRLRLEGRQRRLRHVPEPTWAEVGDRARTYEAWEDEPLVIDATRSVENVVELVLGLLPRAR